MRVSVLAAWEACVRERFVLGPGDLESEMSLDTCIGNCCLLLVSDLCVESFLSCPFHLSSDKCFLLYLQGSYQRLCPDTVTLNDFGEVLFIYHRVYSWKLDGYMGFSVSTELCSHSLAQFQIFLSLTKR